jgi:SAM-dependent methyltransferase
MTNPNALSVLNIVVNERFRDRALLRRLAPTSRENAFRCTASRMIDLYNAFRWTGNCLDDFARSALAELPISAYHREHANEIDGQNFGPGMITARTLLLGRFLSWKVDACYGADNYVVGLGLTIKDLFKLSGKRILDVGCGEALFPFEAKALFNIDVVCLDRNAVPDRVFRTNVFRQYAKNLLFAVFLDEVRPGVEPVGCIGEGSIRDMCLWSLEKTEKLYIEGAIQRGDCTKLAYKDDEFDGCFSSWLFLYLSQEESIMALREMIRVTKSGGIIRVCQGREFKFDAPKSGLPVDLSSVKDMVELPVVKTKTNNGVLRIFEVKKSWF